MVRALVAAVAVMLCVIVLLPVFVVALVLFVFASSVRAVGRMLEPALMTWAELLEYDPALGWKPLPNLDSYYMALGDDVFRIVTDEEGWPGRRSLDQSDVIVIGDSFAFGYGVDTNRSFAALTPQLRVKAIGAPGYSMVHGVLLMEHFANRLNGKLVVWLPCFDNDLQDNLAPEMRGYRAPFVRPDRVRGGWEIVAEHLQPGKWRCSDLDSRRLFPKLCVPGPLADRAYAACDYLINRARTSCSRVGAQLVVVTVPLPMQLTRTGRTALAALSGEPECWDADLPDRRIAESCRRHGVPLIIGKDRLSRSDYKRREGIHWNQQGQRRIARVIEQLYESFRSGTLDRLIPQTTAPGGDRTARTPVGVPMPSSTADRAGAGS